jgi:hypothetical protein
MRCSAPEAGREDPAIDIATPDETSALTTIHADSSRLGLIESALSTSISAVISESAAAYWEYCDVLESVGESPVLDGCVVGDDIGTACGRQLPRGLGHDLGVGDHRQRRIGRDAVAGVALGDRRPTGDDAVVAGGGRQGNESTVDLVGGHLGDVNRFAAAETDEVVGGLGLCGLDDPFDRLETRLLDDDRRRFGDLGANPVARQLVGGRTRDD